MVRPFFSFSLKWSPHSRGWSRSHPGAHPGKSVVPALAGLVPQQKADGPRCNGGPRTRGVGPGGRASCLRRAPWSPHSRGWSSPPRCSMRAGWVVPALAGLVPPTQSRASTACRGPRTRGVGPAGPSSWSACVSWSPHSRGWSLPGHARGTGPAVVPALAGLVPGSPPRRDPRGCGPRTRGVGPSTASTTSRYLRWSPHSRGWSRKTATLTGTIEVVPALAGLVRRPSGPGAHLSRGPRTRGVGP